MVVGGNVSVVIPHRNDLDGLARCLEALASLPDGPHEIIIADNGPDAGRAATDSVVERYRDLPIRLVHEPQPGAAHARNAGVAVARGMYLAFLDCDCRPDADWLKMGCELLGRHAVAGGPVVVSWEGQDGPMTAAAAFDLLFGFDVATSFRRHRHLLTSNLWVRRDVFEAVGPYRPGVSEDVEWCHRAAANGFQLRFDPALIVHHRALPSRRQLHARWRRVTHETWLYGRERGQSRIGWLAKCAVVAASIGVHGVRPLVDSRLTGIGLRLRTFALLADIRLRRAVYGMSLLFGSSGGASR